MRKGRAGRTGIALVTLAAAAGLGAASAQAATVTVTGDDGNPAVLTPEAPGATRVMTPVVEIATPGWVAVSVTGPDGGAAATTSTCSTQSVKKYVDYRGNGAYTVQVIEYGPKDYTCKTPIGSGTYTFSINAGVALPQPTGTFLTRVPQSFKTRTLQMAVPPNPGSSGTEIIFKRNAKLGPDGGIMGAASTGYASATTGIADLRFRVPGVYTVVARAKSGVANSPWSAPVTVRTKAPFDISRVSYPDSRGPNYQLKGHLYDSFARGGKVHISIARGKKGGKFRSLGSAKITRKGTFTKRFRQTNPGNYRLRYIFKGNNLVAGGRETRGVRITRRTFYN